MDSIINEKGRLFYQRRKKNIYQFFYIAPIYIILISFIFVLGAKNNLHIYLSFFLIFFLSSLFIAAMLSNAKKLNRTISNINLNADGSIKFSTFKVLFFESIVVDIKKKELKLYQKKFQINNKEKEEGWIINLNNNKKLYLYKDFFDSNIIDTIAYN